VDDDGDSSGLSGWAWHELGRQSELDHQAQIRTVSAFAARLRGEVPVNVGAVMAENQALWQQNQVLFQRIQELETSNRIWREDYKMLKDSVLDIRDALDAMENGQAS
jgi:hypothetical protein